MQNESTRMDDWNWIPGHALPFRYPVKAEEKCPSCRGTGELATRLRLGEWQHVPCPACEGSGRSSRLELYTRLTARAYLPAGFLFAFDAPPDGVLAQVLAHQGGGISNPQTVHAFVREAERRTILMSGGFDD